jgi:hypothetical protein
MLSDNMMLSNEIMLSANNPSPDNMLNILLSDDMLSVNIILSADKIILSDKMLSDNMLSDKIYLHGFEKSA